MQLIGHCLSDRVQIRTTMIRSGNSTRFTQNEIEEFRQVGLDLSDVKRQHGIEHAVRRWVTTLAGERFYLLEKIASEMAQAKGVKLPPKLTVEPSSGSPR